MDKCITPLGNKSDEAMKKLFISPKATIISFHSAIVCNAASGVSDGAEINARVAQKDNEENFLAPERGVIFD